MATKLIDFIQSAQITKLEEDVNILKNALNLLIGDINVLAPKVTPIVSNLNSLVSSIGNNYDPTDLHRYRTLQMGQIPNPGFHTSAVSTDGLLKRLTEFDDYYTEHISKKMPPLVDLKGQPHVGFETGGTPIEHTHPDGWTASPGACLTATITNNNLPSYIWGGWNTNVWFVEKSTSDLQIPTNATWAGLSLWWHWPRASVYINSSGTVTQSDFRLEGELGGGALQANASFGFGWSVGDELMSMAGSSNGGSANAWYHATVTSIGTQLKPLPPDNAVSGGYTGFIGRTAHDPLSTVHGDPSPGQGGIPEVADWGEGGSHNIMDPSNQLDDQEYITTVLNTGVVPSYLNQEQILFMSDEDKVKRAKKLTRMTLNRLRDAGIWKTTKDVSDGVLTADDFIT